MTGKRFLIVIGVLFILGNIAVRYGAYALGHQAYLKADCTTAVGYYNVIIEGFINSWRLFEFVVKTEVARNERSVCETFNEAVRVEQRGNPAEALVAYNLFFPSVAYYGPAADPLKDAIRKRGQAIFRQTSLTALASIDLCDQGSAAFENGLIPEPDINQPVFYIACAQTYTKAGDVKNLTRAVLFHKLFLEEFGTHAAAPEVELALLANPASCEKSNADKLLGSTALARRSELLPSLLYKCGQALEQNKKYADAVEFYDRLVRDYPNYSQAAEAKAGLARALVARAKEQGAGSLPAPQRAGSAGGGTTVLAIQNDSPKALRIVLTGPETRIETLAACVTCITYSGSGPGGCPKQGPVGTYTLAPGTYSVYVEATGGGRATPFIGTWTLESGQYSQCFYLVTR